MSEYIKTEQELSEFKEDNCVCEYYESLELDPNTFYQQHGCCETCFYL